MIEPFTNADEVRALIGVTEEELTDETLGLEAYQMVLNFELDRIGTPENDGALADAFRLVKDIPLATRSSVQRRLYDAVRLFSPFPVVLHLETAVPLFAPKAITDGKAAVTRHSESPFKDQFNRARQSYERFRQNLERAWAAYNSSDATVVSLPTLVRVSSPDTDPVVDEAT